MSDSLISRLSATAVVLKEAAQSLSKEIAEEISSVEAKSRSRDREQIERHVLSGMICELGVAQLIGHRNDIPWDVSNRNSYSYDVLDSEDKLRIEVKHQYSDHWSFSPTVIKTLLLNIVGGGLDKIVTASYTENTDRYIVTPRMVIDPYTFKFHMKRSQYSSGQFYYDHRTAVADKHCVIL